MSTNGTPKKILHTIKETEIEETFYDAETIFAQGSKSVEDISVPKRRHGFLHFWRAKSESLSSGLGRFQGACLNKIVKTGMQTPLVKYLLSPQTLKKALNNDPILMETYKIIFKSEPVQNLMTPEAMQIMLDSQTAKQVITPENFLTLLNSDVVSNFMTPENIKFILGSQVMRKVCGPEALLDYMESKTGKSFLTPEVFHEISYSEIFTGLMTPDMWASFITTSGVKAIMTPEAISDALACPGSVQTMNQEFVDKLMAIEGVQNLLAHSGFREQFYRFVTEIDRIK